MSVEPIYMVETFSSIAQTVATIISIYLAILIFTLRFFWKNKKYRRNTTKLRKKIIIFGTIIISILVLIGYFFVYPTTELGIWNYIIPFSIILYNYFNIRLLIKTKDIHSFELGITIFSILFAITSFITGFYLIISSVSSIPNVDYLNTFYFFRILKFTRLFFCITLISFIYLISSILIHKLVILKENN